MTYNLKKPVKRPACFKKLEKSICIDVILTDRQKYFQNSSAFETELADFNKLIFVVLKAYFQKQKPRVSKYRNCKKFDKKLFINDLLNELLSKIVQTKHLDSFKAIAQYVFDRHGHLKEKILDVPRLHL